MRFVAEAFVTAIAPNVAFVDEIFVEETCVIVIVVPVPFVKMRPAVWRYTDALSWVVETLVADMPVEVMFVDERVELVRFPVPVAVVKVRFAAFTIVDELMLEDTYAAEMFVEDIPVEESC